MDFNTRRVRVNGLELNVIIEGEGPDVLLVHGFPDDHAVWRKQIPALVAAGYRVIAPDTRGCGDSDVPSRVKDYRVDLLVSDLVGLLDVLGIEKVRVVAHDWGAIQAWYFAIRHPERVERYIALSVGHPAAYARGGLGQKLRGYYALLIQFRHVVEFLVTRFDWWLFALITGYPEEIARWQSRLSRPGRLTAGFNYYRANLHLLFGKKGENVRVPVVGIWSSGDRFLVERQMTNSARYCRAGWTYVHLAGPNHWLQLTSPETVNSLLLQHLA